MLLLVYFFLLRLFLSCKKDSESVVEMEETVVIIFKPRREVD